MGERERLLQIARLAGIDVFSERFGAPLTAEPDAAALRAFIAERADSIARSLIEEAAASDDVTDRESAESYLEDRLRTLAIEAPAAERIRVAFREGIAGW